MDSGLRVVGQGVTLANSGAGNGKVVEMKNNLLKDARLELRRTHDEITNLVLDCAGIVIEFHDLLSDDLAEDLKSLMVMYDPKRRSWNG